MLTFIYSLNYLVLYTGGTIGMMRNPDGALAPQVILISFCLRLSIYA